MKLEGLDLSKWAVNLHRASLRPIKAAGFSIRSKLYLEGAEWPLLNRHFWLIRYLLTNLAYKSFLQIFRFWGGIPPPKLIFELYMGKNLLKDHNKLFLTPSQHFLNKVVSTTFCWPSTGTGKLICLRPPPADARVPPWSKKKTVSFGRSRIPKIGGRGMGWIFWGQIWLLRASKKGFRRVKKIEISKTLI